MSGSAQVSACRPLRTLNFKQRVKSHAGATSGYLNLANRVAPGKGGDCAEMVRQMGVVGIQGCHLNSPPDRENIQLQFSRRRSSDGSSLEQLQIPRTLARLNFTARKTCDALAPRGGRSTEEGGASVLPWRVSMLPNLAELQPPSRG